jgi:cytoskeletal protein CcmA (bactofilin family)
MIAEVFDHGEKKALAGTRPSASVRGAGELGGGDYERVLILGAGEVTGDIRAGRIRSYGSGEVHGRAELESLRTLGAFEVDADLEVERAKAFGAFDVGGSVRAQSMRVLGACTVRGSVRADEVHVVGAFDADTVESATFLARGAVDVDGLLSGDTVELHIGGGHSDVGEIGGGRVEVWRSNFGKRSGFLKVLGSFFVHVGILSIRSSLRVGSVEADDVLLENTCAKVVRGRRVEIRAGCTIEEVEYSESLTVHPKAHVGTRTKL